MHLQVFPGYNKQSSHFTTKPNIGPVVRKSHIDITDIVTNNTQDQVAKIINPPESATLVWYGYMLPVDPQVFTVLKKYNSQAISSIKPGHGIRQKNSRFSTTGFQKEQEKAIDYCLESGIKNIHIIAHSIASFSTPEIMKQYSEIESATFLSPAFNLHSAIFKCLYLRVPGMAKYTPTQEIFIDKIRKHAWFRKYISMCMNQAGGNPDILKLLEEGYEKQVKLSDFTKPTKIFYNSKDQVIDTDTIAQWRDSKPSNMTFTTTNDVEGNDNHHGIDVRELGGDILFFPN